MGMNHDMRPFLVLNDGCTLLHAEQQTVQEAHIREETDALRASKKNWRAILNRPDSTTALW
jgi:hypothetical protein